MKMIILAAGQGKRLRPLTNDKPKCMVKYKGKPIIDYILDTASICNLTNVAIVHGYKKKVLETYLIDRRITFFENKQYEKTNMLATLFCAEEFMNDDIIISYADIIYTKEVLQQLIESKEEISVVVDRKWKDLWSLRMEDPLNDAETLKVIDGNIVELGKKPTSYDEIEGQYIGLIKIKKEKLNQISDFYHALDKYAMYDGQDYSNMYMTSFIQMIIDNISVVKPVYIDNGWLEVDSVEDLEVYEKESII